MICGIGFFILFTYWKIEKSFLTHGPCKNRRLAKFSPWAILRHPLSSVFALWAKSFHSWRKGHKIQDDPRPRQGSGDIQTPQWWPPCFFSKLSWLWLQLDLQVGNTEGQALFPNLLKCSLSTNGNSVPDAQCPRTEEETAIGDFCLDTGRKE